MKKLLLLGALLSSLAMAKNTVEVRAGIDFTGGSSHSYGQDYHTKFKNGFELSGEYRTEVGTGFEVGAGVAYRYNKIPKVDGFEVKGFHSVPLYVTGRYNFDTGSEIVPYVKANLGYGFNSGSLKNNWSDGNQTISNELKFGSGIYYGVGAGINYNNFVVDLTWSNTHTKATWSHSNTIHQGAFAGSYNNASEKLRVNHNVVTLSAGYSFGF